VILGNIPGARTVGDPNPTWVSDIKRKLHNDLSRSSWVETGKIEVSAVMTRSQVEQSKEGKKELNVVELKPPITGKQKEFAEEQKVDGTLGNIFRHLGNVRYTKTGESWYEIKNNGILYRRYKKLSGHGPEVRKQVVLPKSRRLACVKLAHEALLGGHMGVMKTFNRIAAQFYWPGIQGDITRFCRSCDICQRTMPKGKVSKVPLDEMPTIDIPFKRVAVDIVGPIYPVSSTGKRFILTMVDYATRYPEAIALTGIDTVQVAEAMLEMYSRVGFPEEVLSDMGTQFTSQLMREVSRLISVRRLTTTPYHPICNGLCEKINGVLKQILRRLCSERPEDWDRYLPAVLFAYREVPQDSTGFSPFELLYGRDVRGPMNILKEVWLKEKENSEEVQNVYQYVLDLRDRIEHTCELARQELLKAGKKYKKYYDRKARSRMLQTGDQVLILLPTDNNKLLVQWKGPFKVLQRMGKYTYSIEIKGKPRTFHINMLKQYWEPMKEEDLDVSTVASMILTEDGEDGVSLTLPSGQKETYLNVQYSDSLSEEQLEEVKQLVSQYKHIFSDKPGTTYLEEHRIELTTDESIQQKPYPLPYAMREEVRKEIDQMLEDGIIEHSDSPYAFPIVVVKKSDGSNRVCGDLRKLNQVTVFDGEPMPSTDDIFNSLRGDSIFSKFDLSKGFYQIPIKESDKPKTSFVTPDGKYQFCKMPFGAINSTATFNRLMRKCFGRVDKVHSFVDDVLVHDSDWDDHIQRLAQVFRILSEAGLTVKPTKCYIGYAKIEFLGHEIGKGSISPQVSKVQKVIDALPPTTKKEVRSFLGLIGYYRRFIPNFSMIASPITDLTKKGCPNKVIWSGELQKAFDKLKSLIIQEPILRMPDFSKIFYVQTDASDVGAGGVLLQIFNEVKCPIAFFSKKFSPVQRNYSVTEKECLAIIWTIQKFEIFLYGREFILETDHQALTFIDQVKSTNSRIMRWALFLQNYRFQVLAIKGSDNVIADYLSRSSVSS
jgi:hypothetical protein